MGSILISLPKSDDANKIAGMIKNRGLPFDINICETSSEILRVANDRDYGVVICAKRLRDMSYAEMADMLPRYFGIIVLTNDASLEMAREDMVKLLLPFRAGDLIDTIFMLTQSFNRRPKKKREVPPKRSDEEKRLIDNAKKVLMGRNGMTEPEAFRYIQKNSMDYGRKLIESAQMILTLYGD